MTKLFFNFLILMTLITSCQVTETEYMFEKDTPNYNLAVAEIAKRCRTSNEKLVDKLTLLDNFDTIFGSSGIDRVFKLTRTLKVDGGTAKNIIQYIRLDKTSSSSMIISFVSNVSTPIYMDDDYQFTYTSQNNSDLRTEIINGVCDPESDSYAGDIENSSTVLSFTDSRREEGATSGNYQLTAETGTLINTTYPAIFYKWLGAYKRETNLDSTTTTVEEKIEYSKPEINEINLSVCTADTTCNKVFIGPLGACNLSVTSDHYLSDDPLLSLGQLSGDCPDDF